MFWTTALRTVRTASRASTTRVAKPRTYAATTRFIGIRFNSSKPESDETALKQARKLKDKLNHNWDTPILTYEQLKPKTVRPSPVCITRLHSRHLVLISPVYSQDAYLIDVREPDEVIQGSIPSSVNLPLSVLSNSLHLSKKDFKEKHGFDKPRADQEIIFYCRSGKRSATACDIAKRNGYTK